MTDRRPGARVTVILFAFAVQLALALKLVVGADGPVIPRELRLPDTPFDYSLSNVPADIRKALQPLDNTPVDNPVTDHGATLGRVLFYDKTLSANGTTSCASCHLQSHGFSDPNPTSVGFKGERVTRNSMSLINLRFYQRDRFFWDERAAGLEQQVLMPIENPIEMGSDLDAVVARLRKDPIYPPLFEKAFGSELVDQDRIARALAQFVRSIVSFNSRYDQGLQVTGSPKEPFPNFTDQENLGKQVFFGRARCAECHLPEHENIAPNDRIFQLGRPMNNGLEIDAPDVDAGVATQTGERSDRGLFKASTLRNVELTAPYMHDGRFRTIDQVIEHYNWSVQPHANLDDRLQDFSANGLALPEVPKVALAKFLLTLTDHDLATDPRFSDPFVR